MEGSNPFIFIAISHSTPHTTPTQNLIIFTLRSHIHYKCVSLKYILHHNHHLLLALLASSAGIELISLSVRVTSAKFQQSVGGTETGTHTPYISVICFYFSSRKFLFLLSKNMNFWFLFLLSKVEIRISNFSFYSRNSRSEFQISLSPLEIRDQNLKFLFLLSKFEIRISNFSFYSRNSRSEF